MKSLLKEYYQKHLKKILLVGQDWVVSIVSLSIGDLVYIEPENINQERILDIIKNEIRKADAEIHKLLISSYELINKVLLKIKVGK